MTLTKFLVLTGFALLVLPAISLLKRDEGRLARRLFFTLFFLAAIFLTYIYLPGINLWFKANGGDAAARYELSRWNLSFSFGPDRVASFDWLEQSAGDKYPPALYTIGLMYKRKEMLPPGFVEIEGPDGETMEEWGEILMEEATDFGFEPKAPEEVFLRQKFGKWEEDIPFSPRKE